MHPAGDSRHANRSVWKVGLLIAAATAAHVAVNGYSFGGVSPGAGVLSRSSDHSNVLPWVHHYADPSLFVRDYQITMSASYGTVLWPLVGIPCRALPIEWVFFAGHVLSLAAAHALIFLLARRWSASDGAAFLACLLFVGARQCPAGEATHDAAFYTRGAALPLALGALLLALRGSWRMSCALLFATGLVHGLSAFYAGVVIAATQVAESGSWNRRHIAAITTMFASIALASWIVGGGADLRLGRPSDAWMQMQYGSNSMHLFPGSWPMRDWIGFVAAMAILALEALRPGFTM